MSVALSVVFTGLCALVADGDRAPGQMLLVDAKGLGEVGGVVLPEHAPTLVARLGMLANADTSDPTRVVAAWPGRGSAADQVGLWDLTGSEVRIRIQGGGDTGLELFRPANGKSSWPEPPRNADDPAAWRDLRFVADMKVLAGDGRIHPAFITTDAAAPPGLPRGVATRIHLDAGVLEAGLPSQDAYRDDVFEFKGAGAEPKLRQALTDSIRWRLEAAAAAVVIEIVPMAGGPVKRLVLTPSATPHTLFISNLPATNAPHGAHHDLSDEEMGALHFGAYYKLLMNEPAEKPLPTIWRAAVVRKGAGLIEPAFCPPVLFSRP